MDAIMQDSMYRSLQAHSFFGTKFPNCDLTLRCFVDLVIGDQCFYVPSDMINPYEGFRNLIQQNRVVRRLVYIMQGLEKLTSSPVPSWRTYSGSVGAGPGRPRTNSTRYQP